MINEVLKKRVLNFKNIVDIQNVLNEKADPNNPNWKEARTVVDYKLAAILEMAELTESTPWKWWKGGSADLWNVKIEAIDMLHFLASSVSLNKSVNVDNFSLNLGHEGKPTSELFINGDPNEGTDRNKAFDIIKTIATIEDDYTFINYIMKECGLTTNEISAIYIAKYTLNEIRWAGGYALDQYKKYKSGYINDEGVEVEGVEDNVFLKRLVDKFEENKEMTLGDLRESVLEVFHD